MSLDPVLAQTVATAAGVLIEDVDGTALYPDGSIVGTTVQGQKIVVDPVAEADAGAGVTITVGPGGEPPPPIVDET